MKIHSIPEPDLKTKKFKSWHGSWCCWGHWELRGVKPNAKTYMSRQLRRKVKVALRKELKKDDVV